jgi:hypothetical protein
VLDRLPQQSFIYLTREDLVDIKRTDLLPGEIYNIDVCHLHSLFVRPVDAERQSLFVCVLGLFSAQRFI